MQERLPPPRDARPPLPDFAPVPRRTKRFSGWTPERQRTFVEALADTGSVRLAARTVNKSPESAYMLRRAAGADEFAAAWDAALAIGADRIEDGALDRAIHGVPVPHYHAGQQVGERRVFNERLTMWMLQHRKPETYGHARKGSASADDQERAERIRQHALDNCEAWLDKLSFVYGDRIRSERRARLEGDVVAADFYLRQLTHMEVLIELGGGGKHLLWWANGGNGEGGEDDPHNAGVEIAATEVTETLDAMRRNIWAKLGEPDRPRPFGNRAVLDHGMRAGPDLAQRQKKLAAARARAAAAQKEWEEAVREQVEALSGPPERSEPGA